MFTTRTTPVFSTFQRPASFIQRTGDIATHSTSALITSDIRSRNRPTSFHAFEASNHHVVIAPGNTRPFTSKSDHFFQLLSSSSSSTSKMTDLGLATAALRGILAGACKSLSFACSSNPCSLHDFSLLPVRLLPARDSLLVSKVTNCSEEGATRN